MYSKTHHLKHISDELAPNPPSKRVAPPHAQIAQTKFICKTIIYIVIVFLDSIPVFAFHLIVCAHINTFNLQANVFLIEEDDYQTAAQDENDANNLSRGEP